jgi:hypothetical protein
VSAQALDVQRDRLTDQALDLLDAVPGDPETGQLWGIGAEVGLVTVPGLVGGGLPDQPPAVRLNERLRP